MRIWLLLSVFLFAQIVSKDSMLNGNVLSGSPRIALVKQVTYQDLYCCSSAASPKEVILSSFWRTGPVGLFTAYNADFFILHLEDDPECRVWEEKARHPGGPPFSFYLSLRTEPQPGHDFAQGAFACQAAAIDWGKYDIVICLDIPIPARITQQYPQTLWAYYIGEPGRQPSYAASFEKPITGYDCFLTQNFSEHHPLFKSHVIEFPYNLQYYPCYHQLLNIPLRTERKGILLQLHTALNFSKGQKKRLNALSPLLARKNNKVDMQLENMLQILCKAKYFILFARGGAGKRDIFRGNVIIDPVAAGSLIIAHPDCLLNKDLLSPLTSITSFEQLLERIRFFENNPIEYNQELELQRKKCNYLCFERPMAQLFEHCAAKKLNNMKQL